MIANLIADLKELTAEFRIAGDEYAAVRLETVLDAHHLLLWQHEDGWRYLLNGICLVRDEVTHKRGGPEKKTGVSIHYLHDVVTKALDDFQTPPESPRAERSDIDADTDAT